MPPSPSAAAAFALAVLLPGCAPHLVRVDLDSRSRPFAVTGSNKSCQVAGPEIDLDEPELERGVLGWPANSLVGREDGVLFPMRPRLSARAVVDPCDPSGFRPRLVFLLRGTGSRSGCGDGEPDVDMVLDSFAVPLEIGDLPSAGLPVPPGASLQQRSARFATVGIAKVGDEPLRIWGERVTSALKSLDPYARLSDRERRMRDSLMEAVVWKGGGRADSTGSRRLLVLKVGDEASSACWNQPRCVYRIAIDQESRRFAPVPESGE